MTEPELTMSRPASVLKSSTYFGEPVQDRAEVRSLFQMADDSFETEEELREDDIRNAKVEGTGGSIYGDSQRQLTKFSNTTGLTSSKDKANKKQKQVWEALASLEKDSTL